MSVLSINLAQPYPLPLDSFSVVSAELASLDPFKNITRTQRMRELLQQNDVAFIEAKGVYQGASEACFVIPAGRIGFVMHLAAVFQQESVLTVYDRHAAYQYTDGRETVSLKSWRIVDPATDPCLVIPGFPPIQFY